MNHKKQLLCGLAALLLCTGMLGGCGKKEQSEQETEKPAASEAAPESAADAETSAAPADQAAPAEAKAALQAFLDGCINRDIGAVEAAADYRGMLSAYSGGDFTDAEWQEAAGGMLFGAFDSYEIGEGSSPYQELVDYNTNIKQFLKNAEEGADPADDEVINRCIAFLRSSFSPADAMSVFPVTLLSEGDAQTDTMKLVLVDGSWKIDLCEGVLQRIMYLRKSRTNRVRDVNTAASVLLETASAALSQMSEEGIDTSVLSGEYYFTAAEFELVNQPDTMQTEDEVLTELRRRIKRDDPDIAGCMNSAVRISGGSCTAAAAEILYDSDSLFGSAPAATDAEQAESVKDIRAALAAAG